ncbi:MAG: phage tail sheath C-terminal domain-containing protein, partial [Bacteroidota bacterium]|nr:phage tail sheath C-terminal domain-containing protein [Bacteroidota bacterium]
AIADITVALAGTDFTALTVGSWPLTVASVAPPVPGSINEANDNSRRIAAVNLLQPMFDELNTAYLNLIVNAGNTYVKTLDASLALVFPVYKNILNGVSNSMTVMPPSGAVAGVYAQVDRTRGVWKAPANVSLNNVLAPATVFTATQLDNLNVDAVAGKSVNAIRYFTGKGTLVFGSRTLAGNDNEWRYVPVRRFFNMVEESCKKSTEPFVFEPNDANTWVKIQGMIENFLTTLWRQGALQGVKPEHAFYVAVGLGKTMTSLDILEGRLIVEIGMAVVRPAEFIILRFSHKLAES